MLHYLAPQGVLDNSVLASNVSLSIFPFYFSVYSANEDLETASKYTISFVFSQYILVEVLLLWKYSTWVSGVDHSIIIGLYRHPIHSVQPLKTTS